MLQKNKVLITMSVIDALMLKDEQRCQGKKGNPIPILRLLVGAPRLRIGFCGQNPQESGGYRPPLP
jgi:hypothetical protein